MGNLDRDSIVEAIEKYPGHTADWYAGFCDQPEYEVRVFVQELIFNGLATHVCTSDKPYDAIRLRTSK